MPSLIPTRSGQVVSVHSDFLWRLTRHIDAPSSPNDPAACDLMLNLVLRLHKALDSDFESVPDLPRYRGPRARSLIAANHTISRSSFTQKGARHPTRGCTLAEAEPRSVIHPSHSVCARRSPLNALIRRDGWAGILDFEACGRGPAVLDFANMCSTLFMWSRLDTISGRIAALVSSFEEKTDVPIGLDIVHISMLTHWFGHCFDWRERKSTDENTEVVRRLLGRIEVVLHFAAK
jgi:hypothetical protein